MLLPFRWGTGVHDSMRRWWSPPPRRKPGHYGKMRWQSHSRKRPGWYDNGDHYRDTKYRFPSGSIFHMHSSDVFLHDNSPPTAGRPNQI